VASAVGRRLPGRRGNLIAEIVKAEAAVTPLRDLLRTNGGRPPFTSAYARRMFPSRSPRARRKLLKSLVPVAGIEPATY
jgi:hypothetical protein